MKITNVKIMIPSEKSKKNHAQLLAFASVILDFQLVIHDIKLIDGEDGLFIAFPSKEVNIVCPYCESKTPVRFIDCIHCSKEISLNDEKPHYADITHPITKSLRTTIQSAIISEYMKVLNPVEEISDDSFAIGIF